MGNYQLCFLDWYRSRWYVDFRYLVPDPSEVAHISEPSRRSDDLVRCDVCGYFPGLARWTTLDGLLPRSGAKRKCGVAELQKPASLGRIRRLNLLYGVGSILVPGIGTGSRHYSRPL